MKKLTIAAVLALVVAAAGCGGGGSKTLSKEEYGSRLNQICSDLNAEVKKIGTPNSIATLAANGPKLLSESEKALAKAKKLNAPDEIEDAATKFIALQEQERDLVSDLIKAAKDNDLAKVQSLGAQIDPLETESNDIAKNQLGAPACAQTV